MRKTRILDSCNLVSSEASVQIGPTSLIEFFFCSLLLLTLFCFTPRSTSCFINLSLTFPPITQVASHTTLIYLFALITLA
ncbi:hypothetical protein V8F20_002964 [Naviculisporaceae sp. PSN 640]